METKRALTLRSSYFCLPSTLLVNLYASVLICKMRLIMEGLTELLQWSERHLLSAGAWCSVGAQYMFAMVPCRAE